MVVVSDLNKKFGVLTELAKKWHGSADLHAPIPGGGGGGTPRKIGWGVRPASQNPYPIYDQDLRYSLPYL